MSNSGGDQIRYTGVRKRKWGKYVAEIRSGRRSRISLGSYFTAEAAARAYDTALLCLRGPGASSFNFPDSAALDLAAAHESNPSPEVIRTTAIAIGSEFDTVPARYHDCNLEAGPSADQTHFGEGVDDKDAADKVEEEEEMGELNATKYLMQSPKGISFEERVQMSLLLPEDKEPTQPCDNADAGPSADKETSAHFGQGVDDKLEDEEDSKYLLQCPAEITFEERVQMSLLLPDDKETTQPYHSSSLI